MGGMLELGEFLLNCRYGNWLNLSLWQKLPIFGLLCILGVASFAITAKLTGVLDINDILKLLSRRGKKNAESKS